MGVGSLSLCLSSRLSPFQRSFLYPFCGAGLICSSIQHPPLVAQCGREAAAVMQFFFPFFSPHCLPPPSWTRVPSSTARSRTRSKWCRPPTCRCPAPFQMTLAWIPKLLMCPRVSTWWWYRPCPSSPPTQPHPVSPPQARLLAFLCVSDFAC